MGSESVSRRQFIRKAGGYAAGILFITNSHRVFGANERPVLGFMGSGGRGSYLADHFCTRGDCDITWIADPDMNRVTPVVDAVAKKLGRAPQGTQDFRHILDDDEVDGLIITTPDHWHALGTIMACQAGKDVYVEKPTSHNTWEGRQMVDAARKYERIVQVGTQNRSAPYAQAAVDYIRNGELGEVHFVRVLNMKQRDPIGKKPDAPVPEGVDYDMWVGPAPMLPFNPNRFHYTWHWFWDFSGGDIINDGVHQIDLARWLVGRTYPISVSSTGGKYAYDDDQETPDTQSVHWEFDDLTMTFNLTLWTPYMKKTDFAFRATDEYPNWTFNATKIELFGTKGLMMFGRHADGWQVYGMDWNVAAQANGPEALKEHTGNFLDCMKTRRRPNADIEEGHLSTFLCQMANISYRMGGRKLVLDVENESFKDDHDANELLKRSGRKPYRVPEDV